jgi:Enoyl-CoA hydratase/isomerase
VDKRYLQKLMHIWRLSKPVIAAVNGWAMGGGFWYQAVCEITIASEQAVFAQPEVRHISNTTFLFAAFCGWKAASRYALTGGPRAADASGAQTRRTHRNSSRSLGPDQQDGDHDGLGGGRDVQRDAAQRTVVGTRPLLPWSPNVSGLTKRRRKVE